jgi:hypothetical protein
LDLCRETADHCWPGRDALEHGRELVVTCSWMDGVVVLVYSCSYTYTYVHMFLHVCTQIECLLMNWMECKLAKPHIRQNWHKYRTQPNYFHSAPPFPSLLVSCNAPLLRDDVRYHLFYFSICFLSSHLFLTHANSSSCEIENTSGEEA